MAAKTTAERQAAYRARKTAAEQTEVRGVFAHPDDHAAIKEHAEKLARKRERQMKQVNAK